jgi:hypothetical protein
MLFATGMPEALVGLPDNDGTPRFIMQIAANVDITTREGRELVWQTDPDDAEHGNEPVEKVASRVRGVAARAEAIR